MWERGNKNFGRIRPDGVVIRSQWDVRVSYTFVEFEENVEKENLNLKMLKKLPKIKVLSWGRVHVQPTKVWKPEQQRKNPLCRHVLLGLEEENKIKDKQNK